jgi:SAM-dependent methyltransferase
VLDSVARYYAEKLRMHGATARGVDWNSADSQDLRFTELLRICRGDRSAVINDFGCGYGALAARLRRDGYTGAYLGYDLSPEMVHAATIQASGLPNCRFTSEVSELTPAEYTIASGIFNVRLSASVAIWEQHVRETIDQMAAVSLRGFAFNMLTSFADADRMRDDLYYADPAMWVTFCLRRFPRAVTLVHDYPLYEFTMLVCTDQD